MGRRVVVHNHFPIGDTLPDGVARDVARWKAKIQEHRQQLVQYKDEPAEVRSIKKDIAELERMISDAEKMYR